MSIAADSVDYMFPPLSPKTSPASSKNIAMSQKFIHLKSMSFTKPEKFRFFQKFKIAELSFASEICLQFFFFKKRLFSNFTFWRVQTGGFIQLDDKDLTEYENKRKNLGEKRKKSKKQVKEQVINDLNFRNFFVYYFICILFLASFNMVLITYYFVHYFVYILGRFSQKYCFL